MKFLPRRENRAERKVKAFKATEQGIAGHQAASKALGNAAGWDKMNLFGTEMAVSTRAGSIFDAPHTNAFKPGEGNLDVKHEDY